MTRLRVGLAVPDVSRFERINPAYGIGDQWVQANAVLAGWQRSGSFTSVAGDIELVPERFSVIDTEGKRAAADAFAGADVLGVIGGRDFTYGAVRLAEHHAIPVIDVNAVPASLLLRTTPWMFTLRAAQDVLYASFVRWADRRGLLDGVIGVFSDRFTRESTATAIAEMRGLGYEVAAWIGSDGAGVGSERDRSAAEEFLAAGVGVVLPFVSGSSLMNFLEACVDIGYQPRIVDLETGEHTTAVTAHLMPASIYAGTRALTMSRSGELTAEGRQVLDDFETYTGRRLDPMAPETSGEVSNLLIVSDLLRLLLSGITSLAGEPSRQGLVGALEGVRGLRLASGGDGSFGPGEHWAIRQVREVRWDDARSSWIPEGVFEPIVRDHAGNGAGTRKE